MKRKYIILIFVSALFFIMLFFVQKENIKNDNTPLYEVEYISEPTENLYEYTLNINSKKFHYPFCSSAKKMKEENKKTMYCPREEIIAMGYVPCGRCCP